MAPRAGGPSVLCMGQVSAIYLAASAGLPMWPVEWVVAVAGQGLLGDRYQTGSGEWSYDPRLRSDVTLIAVEVLAVATAESGHQLGGGASRRNVHTQGVALDSLVGRHFTIGEVELRGERPCEPCRYLDRITSRPAKAALQGRGGLRATVIVGGRLAVGDAVLDYLVL